MSYQIRPAVPNDIKAIITLDRAITSLPHWPVANYLAALSAALHTTDSYPQRCLFVAESGLAIVGVAAAQIMRVEDEIFAELETVGVAETARQAGIGRSLCVAIVDWARERGASTIELEVRSQSPGPITLYKSLGFEVSGQRSKYYREPSDDAVLMKLGL